MGVLGSAPLIAVILTGCLVTASFPCLAKHQSLRDKILDFKSSHFTSINKAEAGKVIHPIFQYIYADPLLNEVQNKDPAFVSLQNYKAQLRNMLAYELSDDFRVGLNSFKVGPIEQSKTEIIMLEPQLQPRSADVSKSRGYGVSFTLKLN